MRLKKLRLKVGRCLPDYSKLKAELAAIQYIFIYLLKEAGGLVNVTDFLSELNVSIHLLLFICLCFLIFFSFNAIGL